MSGTQESGAYLGGIGVMLEVSNVCPACGQVHDGPKFGLKHRRLRECPRVVIGSFPLVSLPSPPEQLPLNLPGNTTAPARKSRTTRPVTSTPVLLVDSLGMVRPVPETTRGRSLALPWLPLPELGEVF